MANQAMLRMEHLCDSDGLWQIVASVSTPTASATLDFYADPGDLAEFARRLSAFPTSQRDAVQLEIGRLGENWVFYVLFRAFLVDGRGHSALAVVLSNNRLEPQHRQYSEMSITNLEPAQLNRLGHLLSEWLAAPGNPLEWSPNPAT